MSLSQISTIYISIIPYFAATLYHACGFDISLIGRELLFLYTVNVFHFICGSQWALSAQTLSSKSKIIPIVLVVAGILPQLVILHGEFISASFLLGILYILQLSYDLSSEIAYCSQRSYKVARIISTCVICYSLGYLIA